MNIEEILQILDAIPEQVNTFHLHFHYDRVEDVDPVDPVDPPDERHSFVVVLPGQQVPVRSEWNPESLTLYFLFENDKAQIFDKHEDGGFTYYQIVFGDKGEGWVKFKPEKMKVVAE
jgi:hypothetical protein